MGQKKKTKKKFKKICSNIFKENPPLTKNIAPVNANICSTNNDCESEAFDLYATGVCHHCVFAFFPA